ncbi:MAG: hypothetical protein AMJ79_14360 [Phycisphaerae bacterium SM23_30]|nr:MAG: hypothetical protein AMJ79_14360 [Phycisphaerae bacterium SM23_30]
MSSTLWRKWLNFVVGLILSIMTLGKKSPDPQLMQRLDYPASTQRMGLRFTEKLRDLFRRRWLKLHR